MLAALRNATRFLAWCTRGEQYGLAALLVLLLILVAFTIRWGFDAQVLIWVMLWAVGLALVVRRFWVGLFGPVFSFDLVRMTRRSPVFSLRCLYAGSLLVILYLLYYSWFGGQAGAPWELDSQVRISIARQAQFANSFFTSFIGVQLAAVLLITPLAVSSAIAEEKEKRTLAFLLATDLQDHEIVLGKLASRLTHLFLFLLTGFPILTLLQFMGGIDPNLVIAWFIADFMTMLGLASVSILCSVNAQKPLGALVMSYLGAGAYMLTSCVCLSPFAALLGQSNGLDLFAEAEQFAAFSLAGLSFVVNCLVMLFCCRAAIANLRRRYRFSSPTNREMVLEDVLPVTSKPVIREQTKEQAAPARRDRAEVGHERELSERRRPRYVPKPNPPIGSNPMLWKENHIERGLGLPESVRALGQIPLIVGVVLLTYLILVCGLQGLLDQHGTGPASQGFTNGLARTVGSFILLLMLLGVTLRAAGSLSAERDRRTLDSLLTTALDNAEILRAKWWASFQYVRKGWWFLALLWFLGVFTLGLHPLAVPLLVFAWFMYAVFAAGLGMWFSLISPTTMRAMMGTFFSFMGSMAAPWAMWTCVEAIIRVTGLDGRYPGILEFRAELLVPPIALAQLAFPFGDLHGEMSMSSLNLGVTLAGTYVYGLLGAAFWSMTTTRFGERTGRMPYGERRETPESSTV